MSRPCVLWSVHLTGLVLFLLSDDPTVVGFGVVLIFIAPVVLIKDLISDELARRRT